MAFYLTSYINEILIYYAFGMALQFHKIFCLHRLFNEIEVCFLLQKNKDI